MSKGPFDELLAGLRAHGRLADAEGLASLMVVGWTSSREMAGELGQAVLALEVPAALNEAKQRCLKEVRKWI
jgi:hypothetical protein